MPDQGKMRIQQLFSAGTTSDNEIGVEYYGRIKDFRWVGKGF